MKKTVRVTVLEEERVITTFSYDKTKGNLLRRLVTELGLADGFCGRGACGRCRVRFLTGAPLPSALERRFFSPNQLRSGWRLACMAKPETDCSLMTDFPAEAEIQVISAFYGAAAGEPEGDLRAAAAAGAEPLFCAVDVGTTTVAMQLVEAKSGRIRKTHSFLNPQRAYGSDVLSRLQAAEELGAQKPESGEDGHPSQAAGPDAAVGPLGALLRTELERGLHSLQQEGQPECVFLAGNTAMGHLLLGYPVTGLGRAPFTPYHLAESHFTLAGLPSLFLPGISAFVGADILAGLYACGVGEGQAYTLFIDLGTNGELALGNNRGILCTATAAGPAFEGGADGGITGTDMLALAAQMRKEGVLLSEGLLREPWFTEGYRKDGVLVRQQDIRNLQMAKAAVYAGIRTLMAEMGIDGAQIGRVCLAGGFGYYLHVPSAVAAGLLPRELAGKTEAVGNAALAGCIRVGRQCVAENAGGYSRENLEVALAGLRSLAGKCESINLARQPGFADLYIGAMDFGEP